MDLLKLGAPDVLDRMIKGEQGQEVQTRAHRVGVRRRRRSSWQFSGNTVQFSVCLFAGNVNTKNTIKLSVMQ